ncbi:nuclear transport factor 2 family protein [Sphingorhabdus sp. SMR4y]|uniref:nuclear transport factor 2 family protein n=1 Tax=Sphingorhabdus sp. SMR4y TaxID=2584094 RepID=UPI000B61F763|nr:nuclear transport factor 2 family protein [Sphingorhabdus sp. SMR4y]ASK89708.1 SnoaL-like domain protein [Sphingorhabdus sp. SMR4y]
MATGSNTTGEDCALISDLIARIALYSDTGSVDDYAGLFTADAIWELRDTPKIEGIDAIIAASKERRAQKVTGPGSDTRHVVLSSVIDRKDNKAQAVSIFQFYTGFSQSPKLHAMGIYKDRFQYREGQWFLSHRLIDFNMV